MSHLPDDALIRHPIYDQVREVLTNPDAAEAAGPVARRFAWFIQSNARGLTIPQRHVSIFGQRGSQ